MKLKRVLDNVEQVCIVGQGNPEITGITHDSRKVQKGFLFVAISGEHEDGRIYVDEAVGKGAVGIIIEGAALTGVKIVQIIVNNARKALGMVAKNFYGKPDERIVVVGVTGTNGKTTTSTLIKNILRLQGEKVGLIGTIGYYINENKIGEGLTTPDPIELYSMLAIMESEGVRFCIMEISAHSIALSKVDCLSIDIAIFTNLTQDHQDFFKTMQNYEKTKMSLFERDDIDYKIINSDDATGLKLIKALDGDCVTYGINNPADVFAVNISHGANGANFVLNIYDSIYSVKTRLQGLFNVYNLLAAVSAAELLDVDLDSCIEKISLLPEIEGRFNVMQFKNNIVVIDYAHTPDGLLNLLQGVGVYKNKNIITVFGCGGDRDTTKRAIMGYISAAFSDYVILTSDNSRSENPLDIINQIKDGIKKDEKIIIVKDRREAIALALRIAENSVVVIAGKGAETTMEEKGIKTPFSDKNIAMDIINSIKQV